MPLQSSGSISMSQINSEVASVNSNSLTTLSTNAIAYNNGQGNGTTNSPYQMKEFLGYTHTQTQGISYSKTSRHGTADSQITAKISKLGIKIHEVPINYSGRSYEEGKKISIYDGFRAIYVLLKYKFFS